MKNALAIALLISIAFAGQACAAEWFESNGVNCSGIQAIGDAFQAYTGGGSAVKPGTGQGQYYVEFSGADYFALLTSASDRIHNAKTLTRSEAGTLAGLIDGAAGNAKIPTFVKVITALTTGLLLPPGAGTGAGLIFAHLFDKWDAYPSSLKESSLFIVDGGDAYRRLAPLRDVKENPFVAATAEYQVRVGNEVRKFVYHGCIYAVAVNVREFATEAQFNNKIVKPTGGNTWRVWDVDTNKFDIGAFTYVRQSEGYYFLESDAIENNIVKGKHQDRISFKGGPWQHKNFFDGPAGSFKTLYGKVVPR